MNAKDLAEFVNRMRTDMTLLRLALSSASSQKIEEEGGYPTEYLEKARKCAEMDQELYQIQFILEKVSK